MTVFTVLVLGLGLVGCQSLSDAPATRANSNTRTVGDIGITICGTGNVVRIEFKDGDGVIASADSAGSTESQTSTMTPTQTITPTTDLNYSKAATPASASTTLAGLFSSLTALLSGSTYSASATGSVSSKTNSSGTSDASACADGSCTKTNCTGSDCAKGSCSTGSCAKGSCSTGNCAKGSCSK